MSHKPIGDKSWHFEIMYSNKPFRCIIRLYSTAESAQWFQLFAKNRWLYLKLDSKLNLTEEIIGNQPAAPREFLDCLQEEFRAIYGP